MYNVRLYTLAFLMQELYKKLARMYFSSLIREKLQHSYIKISMINQFRIFNIKLFYFGSAAEMKGLYHSIFYSKEKSI